MLSFIRNKIINKYTTSKIDKIDKNYNLASEELERQSAEFKKIEEEVNQLQSNIELIKSVHEKDMNAVEQEYESNMNDILSGKILNSEEMQSLSGKDKLKYSMQKQKEAFAEIDKKYTTSKKELESTMKKNLKVQENSLNSALSTKSKIEDAIEKGENTQKSLQDEYLKFDERREKIDDIMDKFQKKQNETMDVFGKYKENFLKQLKEKKTKITEIIKAKTAAVKTKVNELKNKAKEELDTTKDKTKEVLYGKEDVLLHDEATDSFVKMNKGGILNKGYVAVQSFDQEKGGVSTKTFAMNKNGVVNMDIYSHEGAQVDVSPENVLNTNEVASGGYGKLNKDKNGYIQGNVLDVDEGKKYLDIIQISDDKVLVTTTVDIAGKTVKIQKEKSVSEAMKMYNQATALKENTKEKEKEKTYENTNTFERA